MKNPRGLTGGIGKKGLCQVCVKKYKGCQHIYSQENSAILYGHLTS